MHSRSFTKTLAIALCCLLAPALLALADNTPSEGAAETAPETSPVEQSVETAAIPEIGILAPPLSLPNVTGEHFLLGEHTGQRALPQNRRVVILDFFTMDCVPCRREIPHLRQITAGHEDVIVRFVSLDPYHRANEVAGYCGEMQLNPTEVLLDIYQVAAERWGIKQEEGALVPLCIVIGPDGIIRESIYGFPEAEFQERVERAIRGE